MKTLNKFIFLFLLGFISIGVFSGSIVSAQIPQANLPLLFQKKIPLYTAAMSSFGNIRL